jgi:NAD(P)-dependent dehydrogenase (short-subunit alcohol dehydrogenase family)
MSSRCFARSSRAPSTPPREPPDPTALTKEYVVMKKTVLITGAATGFGRDTAETLAAVGHRVFASMRDAAGRNRAAAEALRAKNVEIVELDVTDTASVERALADVVARAGHIDVIVNNAGLVAAGVTEAFTAEQTQAMFDVNVFGALRVARAALPYMRRQRDGLIVNIGSVLGRVTFPFFGLYGASKFALEAVTDSLRYEVSQLGVDVVLVQPSAYPTNMYTSVLQPADAARVEAYGEIGKIPGKMFETFMGMFQGPNAPNPHDVAAAIAKLVNEAKGARAERVVVGQSFGADVVNQQTQTVQKGVVEALGLGSLAAPAATFTAAAE